LHADAVLLFISDHAVPFTNNVAERAVRMPKVKQKISGCFRTVAGAENFCVIRSCLDTLRKQGHSMLDVLQRAFAGNPIQPTA
jgi:transposase